MALAVPPGGSPPPTDHRPDAAPLSPVPRAAIAPNKAPLARLRSAPPVSALSVVVVNFCQWRNTARLIGQLRRSVAMRTDAANVVVVDNHSPFHPILRKLEKLRGVTVRRFSRNLGFARGVNRGVLAPVRWKGMRPGSSAASASDWVLLLNPDVTVEDGFLDDVVAFVEKLAVADPAAGVVGFRLRNRDGSAQASSGPFPTLARTLAGLFRPRSRRKCTHRPESTRQPVDWVTGGCLLVRRDCFRQLGGLDESFFLYYEDVDFCRRAAAAGWGVWFDPSLEVTHHWPLHLRRVPAPLRLMTRHALLTYAKKHWSGLCANDVGRGVDRSRAAPGLGSDSRRLGRRTLLRATPPVGRRCRGRAREGSPPPHPLRRRVPRSHRG